MSRHSRRPADAEPRRCRGRTPGRGKGPVPGPAVAEPPAGRPYFSVMRTLRPTVLLCLGLLPAVLAAAPAATIDAARHPTLQAAFDAVPAGGGTVVLPPGTVEIDAPLIVRTGDTRIVGAGAATCIRNVNREGSPALILRPPGIETDKKARLWRVQLADFRLEGQERSGDGILAEFIEELYLEGMSIDHHGGHGIHLKSCHEDPRIADCILTYNKGCGIELVDCHDIVVNANHFEENQDALRCADGFNLCMNGNNIDDHTRHGVVIENTYGSVLSGNMIEECNGTAVILDRDCYGITIGANVVAHHLGGGIDLRDAHGCAVGGNTFVLVHAFGVRVGPDSGRNTISANSFTNSFIGAGADKRPKEGPTPMHVDAAAGVFVDGGRDCVITGNTFTGLKTAAVWGGAAGAGLLITHNLCRDCGRGLAADAPWIAIDQDGSSLVEGNLANR